MMQTGKAKRGVSSCVPCYTRKQKCDRQYPCNRCSRRRRPELCVYHSSTSQASNAQPHTPHVLGEKHQDEDMQNGGDQWDHDDGSDPNDSSPTLVSSGTPPKRHESSSSSSSSLAEVFGYLEQSGCNTMALVRSLIHEDGVSDAREISVGDDIVKEVQKTLEMMPSRPILDFLVGYFVTKVNWIDQLLYPPWFLAQYKRWWSLDRPSSVADIEFPILFLRICCYASQFLPSPAYTIDSIRGMALADIRNTCDEVVNELAPICARLDPRGSLLRVLHVAFAGLTSLCKGRTDAFWDMLSSAVGVAQKVGLHLDTTIWNGALDELEKEMRRRTFCNLYVWDSLLSRRLDRIPLLPDSLGTNIMPRMHLSPDIDVGVNAPDLFTERILRARLAQFWRSRDLAKGCEYDAVAVEEGYESFCGTFLQKIPNFFALQPDKQWDELLPTIPMQRQLLHIAIFESLCYNFRPALLQKPDQVQRLPGYKKMLVLSHKKALAAAALNLLKEVSSLHMMMGGSHTRFADIIVPTFEAAVPLLCLCADRSFPGDAIDGQSYTLKTDPLAANIGNVTRSQCMRAARDALNCLETLADVSSMAEVGAHTLTRLIGRVNDSSSPSREREAPNGAADTVMNVPEPWGGDEVMKYTEKEQHADFLFGAGSDGMCQNWDEMFQGLTSGLGPEEVHFLDAEYP